MVGIVILDEKLDDEAALEESRFQVSFSGSSSAGAEQKELADGGSEATVIAFVPFDENDDACQAIAHILSLAIDIPRPYNEDVPAEALLKAIFMAGRASKD